MRHIAKVAGVSITTVSHVLSGNRPVNPRTAERVLAVIRQYDYVPVSAARRLKQGRSGLVAVVVPDLAGSYFAALAKGVERAAESAGMGMIVCSVSASAPRKHLDMLREGTVDGLVHLPYDPQIDQEVIALATTYPIVIADEQLPAGTDLPTVVADNLDGGRQLGAHLHGLGHRRALVIAGPEAMLSSSQRVVGFREHFPDALVLRGEFSSEAGSRLTREAIASGLSFTCIATGNDEQAVGAIRSLRAAGIRVPEDVSVTGFDDGTVADALGITTVRQPAVAVGVRAGELLIEAVERFAADEVRRPMPIELLPVELVTRSTTAVPPAAD